MDDPAGRLRVVLAQMHLVCDEFQRCLLEADELVHRIASARDGPIRPGAAQVMPLIAHETFTVHWQGSTCVLGPTTLFRLFDRLSRRPNQYVTYDKLISDVWDGQHRSRAAIRSVVRDLRRRLRAADMADLAAAVHGERQCYGLMLDSLS